jgi:hypothetical protein
MPKPPKETMGGFVEVMLSLEKQKLESQIQIVKSLIQTKEYPYYDQDYRNYIANNLKFMEEYKSRLDTIEPISN